MHDIELVVVWFSSIVVGMILTVLMPQIVSEACGSQIIQDSCERISAREDRHEPAGSMSLTSKEA
jgi:hypothetical protein